MTSILTRSEFGIFIFLQKNLTTKTGDLFWYEIIQISTRLYIYIQLTKIVNLLQPICGPEISNTEPKVDVKKYLPFSLFTK